MATATIFALTFIDGLVIAGLVINGWGAFAACFYAYTNNLLPMTHIIFWSFTGVFLAEQISYALCFYYGDRIMSFGRMLCTKIYHIRMKRHWGPLLPSVSPVLWDNAEIYVTANVQQWGGLYLLLGRWTPVASLVPAFCAICKMPYLTFIKYSAAACFLWASIWNSVVYAVAIGYLNISI